MKDLRVMVGSSPTEIYQKLEEYYSGLYEIVSKESKVYFKFPFNFRKEYTFKYYLRDKQIKRDKKEIIDLLKESSSERKVKQEVAKKEEVSKKENEVVAESEQEPIKKDINSFTSDTARTIIDHLEEHEFNLNHIEHLIVNANCTNDSTIEEWIEGINNLLKSELTDWKELNEYQIMTLFGPTGVGKTTTLVKIANRLQTGDKKIGVINTDNYRVGAYEQIKNYSDLYDFSLIQSKAEELQAPINVFKYQKGMDYVLIDTYGRNPKDKEMIGELDSYIANIEPDCACLVLSATQKYKDMKKTINLYKDVRIDYIIITKLDETDSLGFIYNILKEFDLPISYVTFGQNVPGDINTFKVVPYLERVWSTLNK